MKANTIIALSTLLMSSSLVLAAEQSKEHEAHHPDGEEKMTTGASAMTGGCMPMHERMQDMRSQIDDIYQAEDPAKRAELIEVHLDSMNEMMSMMKGMGGMKTMIDEGVDMPGEKKASQHGDMMGAEMGDMKHQESAG